MTRQEALRKARALDIHPHIEGVSCDHCEAAIAAALLEAYADGLEQADEPQCLYMQEISKARVEARAMRGEE